MAYTTIKKPSDYFNTKLYTGNGSSQSITGVGFQPDWIWFKCRSEAQSHFLFDAVRGSNKTIQSHTANAEATSTSLLTSFNSDGFGVGNDDGVNGSSKTYASWNWLADNTSGSSNTDGSITSTVSANTTSGFSIVSYTGNGTSGATIGHGLSSKPTDIFVKSRNDATNWCSQHKALGSTKFMRLNDTRAVTTNTARWNDTEPTTSVFSVGNDSETNQNGNTYIAYCFAEKKGFSKFGSYTGNGSTDGPFIYTGFKPAFIIVKRTDSATDWIMVDNKRAGYNSSNYRLYPNTSSVEDTGFNIDLMSNGFKNTKTNSAINASGGSYIYMAFAEEPLVGDNPATAR